MAWVASLNFSRVQTKTSQSTSRCKCSFFDKPDDEIVDLSFCCAVCVHMSSSKAPFSAINFDKKCKKCHWIVISSILLSNLIKYLALIHTIFIFYAIFKLHALENILYQKSIFPIGSEQPNKKTHISILSISFRFVRSEWWKYIAKCLRVSMEWVTVFRDTASDPYSPPCQPLYFSIGFLSNQFRQVVLLRLS